MTGTTLSSKHLDNRRKKILFRSWHRGIREMDLIMGGFADTYLPTLSEAELDVYEHLMEASDRDIYRWITGETITPINYDTPLFQKMKTFHDHEKPVHK